MRKQIDRIRKSNVLTWYGSALGLTFVLNAAIWYWKLPFHADREQIWPVCYPFLPNCEEWRFLGYQALQSLNVAMGLMGAAVAGLFFARRTAWAYYGLLFLSVLKVLLYSLDYQLIHNAHYMHLFVLLIYLFFPRPQDFLRVQIVLFYFAASLLKFRPDWLNGDTLLVPPIVGGWPLRMALHWAVVLECVLVWALFSRHRWLRYAVLGQLFLFHLISWSQVGYFYPLMMFLMLSIFVFTEMEGEPVRFPAGRAVAVWSAFFMILQLMPHVGPVDPALDGRRRMASLFMLDARVFCTPVIAAEKAARTVILPLPVYYREPRLYCDPVVIAEFGRAYCRRNQRDPHFSRISVFLASRRSTQKQWTTLIDQPDFCALFARP